jgi:hypothetical protein
MHIQVSTGELIDKYTILKIKSTRITDVEKLKSVISELTELTFMIDVLRLRYPGIDQAIDALQNVNTVLWDIENSIRNKENKKEFDEEFINLARSVYLNNDQRAQIKSVINTNTGAVGEVKQYTEYER